VSHVYCLECGFQNPEAANYCAKCGTLLEKDEPNEATVALAPEELPEDSLVGLEGLLGPALVVRSGGGRAGEHFLPQGNRTTIGRSPDCDIFLDDVTVSRNHAVLHRDADSFMIEDQGSLNGTFVNRRRVESAELEDGDELQIGKYRLIYLSK
jgi:FHA domain/zinc-ribbon domain